MPILCHSCQVSSIALKNKIIIMTGSVKGEGDLILKFIERMEKIIIKKNRPTVFIVF